MCRCWSYHMNQWRIQRTSVGLHSAVGLVILLGGNMWCEPSLWQNVQQLLVRKQEAQLPLRKQGVSFVHFLGAQLSTETHITKPASTNCMIGPYSVKDGTSVLLQNWLACILAGTFIVKFTCRVLHGANSEDFVIQACITLTSMWQTDRHPCHSWYRACCHEKLTHWWACTWCGYWSCRWRRCSHPTHHSSLARSHAPCTNCPASACI